MMPEDKNAHPTSTPDATTVAAPLSKLQVQLTLHQHLREQIRSAVQTVMEEVMREELTQFLGAAWGETTKERRGYRNGSYTRALLTSSGPIEELHIPRDREGKFHTQAFERYNCYEPQVAEGLTQMLFDGVSTQKVGEVAQTLLGGSASLLPCHSLHPHLTPPIIYFPTLPLSLPLHL